jgi:hypothetical protein
VTTSRYETGSISFLSQAAFLFKGDEAAQDVPGVDGMIVISGCDDIGDIVGVTVPLFD